MSGPARATEPGGQGKAARPPRPARRPAGGTVYHGTALAGPRDAARARRSGSGGAPLGRRAAVVARVALALALAAAAATAVWKGREPAARALAGLNLGRAPVAVSGLEYLSPPEVLEAAGLEAVVPFFRVDLERARARLARHPRVREARVERWLDGRVHVTVAERVPAVLVPLGRLAEADAAGRVLPALVGGVVPDLPLVTGLAAPRGGWIRDPDFARALRWLRALGAPDAGLAGRISEVDVAAAGETGVVLSPEGARVLLADEPGDPQALSALRVVLADLAAKRQRPVLIDCRTPRQAVVRAVELPAAAGAAAAAAGADGGPAATAGGKSGGKSDGKPAGGTPQRGRPART